MFCVVQLDNGKEYEYHAPSQTPIDPPYSEACLLKKQDLLAKPCLGASVTSRCDTVLADTSELIDVTSQTATCRITHDTQKEDTTEDSATTVIGSGS